MGHQPKPSGQAALIADLQRQLAAALAEIADLQARLARYQRGPGCRGERGRRRNEKLIELKIDRWLSRGYPWWTIREALAIGFLDLMLTTDPPGPLDSLPVEWTKKHTISTHALRDSYRRFVRSASRRPG